jgi:hypothetical protein
LAGSRYAESIPQECFDLPTVRRAMPTHVLMLNDMRSSHVQTLVIAAEGTPDDLEALVLDEGVPTYRDGLYRKSFRAGGPLEWFNQPPGFGDSPIRAVPQGEPGQSFSDGYVAAWRDITEGRT